MLDQQIEAICKDKGVLQIGYADISFLPQQLAPIFPTAISIGFALLNGVMDEIDTEPTHAYFSLYRTVNRLIDECALQIATLLEKEGFKGYTVPASQSISHEGSGFQGAFSHRMAAYHAGLGYIGKNNSIVHPLVGPRLRLGTVLTNYIPLQYQQTPLESECGSCNRCVEACPALALLGTSFSVELKREDIVDVSTCSQFMHLHYQHIGRGSVCGICIAVCPKGGKQNA